MWLEGKCLWMSIFCWSKSINVLGYVTQQAKVHQIRIFLPYAIHIWFFYDGLNSTNLFFFFFHSTPVHFKWGTKSNKYLNDLNGCCCIKLLLYVFNTRQKLVMCKAKAWASMSDNREGASQWTNNESTK